MSSNPTWIANMAARVGFDATEFDRGMDKVGKRLKKGVNDFGNSTGAMAAAAGTGMAAVGTAMSRESNKFQLKAQLGLTAKEAEAAGDLSGRLLADSFGNSLEEVNGAVQAVSRDLADMGDPKAVEDMTQKVLSMSDAFGMDATESVRAVSQMLRTGLAKDADEAFDILTTGMQNGANKGDDLVDTFEEYGVQFQKLGLDGASAMGIMSQAMGAGARNADQVADALKEFAIRSADGSKASINAYKALGLNATEMTETMAKGGDGAAAGLETVLTKLQGVGSAAEREAIAVALFGTKAEDMQKALYAIDPSSATAGLEEMNGATDRLVSDVEKSVPAWEKFKNSFIGALGDSAGSVLPKIQPVMDLVVKFAPQLATAAIGFAGLWAAVKVGQTVMQGVTVATAAYNAVQKLATTYALGTRIQLAALAVQQGITATATKAAAAATWLMNTALLANPLTWVVLALVALGVALVVAWKKSETFRKIVTGAWTGIKKAVGAVVDWLKKAVPAVWNFIKTAFLRFTVLGLVISHWGKIKSFVGGVVDWLKSAPGKAFQLVKTAFLKYSPLGLVISHWDKIVDKISGAKDTIVGFFEDAKNWLLEPGRRLISGLIDGIKSMLPDVGGAMDAIGGKIKGFLPGSPVKEGPLTSWNNGAAGKRLVGMLADGLRDTRPVEDAMGRLSTVASGSFDATAAARVGGRGSAAAAGRGGAGIRVDRVDVHIPAGTRAADAAEIKRQVNAGVQEALGGVVVAGKARGIG